MPSPHTYLPYDNDGYWKNFIGDVGEKVAAPIISNSITKKFPLLSVIIDQPIAAASREFGQDIGWTIDNTPIINHNVNTKLEEVNYSPNYWLPLDFLNDNSNYPTDFNSFTQ